MNAIVPSFHPEQIAIIDHDGGKWLTAEQLGLALGFSANRARDGVNNLYNRHIDEFSDGDSVTIKLMATDGKHYNTRIFSLSGCNLLSFFANTPNAKAFRAWAKVRLAEPAHDMLEVDRETLQYAFDRAERIQAAYLREHPQLGNLARYYAAGLTQLEMAKLLDISRTTVRERLKLLDELGVLSYRPDPEKSRHGRAGYAAMKQALAFKAQQQPLSLEG